MRSVIPLLLVLLLAGAAPAEEPEKGEAPVSPEALTALGTQLDVLQERLEQDLAERIERRLAERFEDGLVRVVAPGAGPARRDPR